MPSHNTVAYIDVEISGLNEIMYRGMFCAHLPSFLTLGHMTLVVIDYNNINNVSISFSMRVFVIARQLPLLPFIKTSSPTTSKSIHRF